MKEYQSDGGIVSAVNDSERTTPPTRRIAETTAAVAAPLPIGRAASEELVDKLSFAFRTESHQSLLNTSSLSLSHSSFDYWPEFQQNYHSIMDNTNLLDSCAAALSDITYDDDDSSGGSSLAAHRRTILFDRSLMSSAASSSSVSFCGKSISPLDVERFSRWLCEMEMRVADQPTLSQIFAMTADEMAIQLKVHSKLYNDIVAQPCILNGSKREEHKLLEERYHLLYLKAYEVQLLLEGLPGNYVNDQTSANKILNKSVYDFDEFNHAIEVDGEDNCDEVNAMDNDDDNSTQFRCEQTCDKNENRLFTRTNKTTGNVGTYYFNYEACDEHQPQQQQRDSVGDNNMTENIALLPIGTEISFTTLYDNEIRSYLNYTDTVYSIVSNEFIVDPIDKSKTSTLLQHFSEGTTSFSQNTRLWNDLDFSPASHHNSVIDHFGSDTEPHNKVRNWLLNKTTDSLKFMSSLSLDRIPGDEDYRMLYRSRSELNLSSRRKSSRSLRSSSNGLASLDLEGSDSGSFVADGSLDWDFYQNVYGVQQQADEDTYADDNDGDEMDLMASKLCDFGNDYSLYLASSTISLNTDGNINAEQPSKSICDGKTIGDSATTAELVVDEEEIQRQKRIRRKRKKRAKKRQQQKLSLATANSKVSSESASTKNASIASSESSQFDSFAPNPCKEETSTPKAPPKTITYDSEANKFEVYSDELGETKQLKVSELRPEDFHGVITMCQNNIDCVITVLAAEPNQVLTVSYCRRMKYERNKSESDLAPKCQCATKVNISKSGKKSSNAKKECKCFDDQSVCICSWVGQTIAMILDFLMDCWNIFRNMKLYTYLCRVLKSLFGSTRYVADHLKMKSELTKLNALKYL